MEDNDRLVPGTKLFCETILGLWQTSLNNNGRIPESLIHVKQNLSSKTHKEGIGKKKKKCLLRILRMLVLSLRTIIVYYT
jgi:hypothetical protein